MKREVIVVTAAYGARQIQNAGGQAEMLPVIAAAGADGVEIRRELFNASELARLPQLAEAIATAGLSACYSVPEALFTAQGELNPHIDRHLHEACQLKARWIKYALGSYRQGADNSVLRKKLDRYAMALRIENDQTPDGRLAALEHYFHHAGTLNGWMAFDMGNWRWTGDDPLEAASRLSDWVGYIHVKVAVPGNNGWQARAPDNAGTLWRETLARLPASVPLGIEFPLEGDDLVAVTRHYVDLLREEAS